MQGEKFQCLEGENGKAAIARGKCSKLSPSAVVNNNMLYLTRVKESPFFIRSEERQLHELTSERRPFDRMKGTLYNEEAPHALAENFGVSVDYTDGFAAQSWQEVERNCPRMTG